MKKRSFIPIASLVVLSGAAAISGTFAWFQTSRTINLTFSDAEVRSRDSNLNVKFLGSLNTLDESSTATGTVASNSGIYDIKLVTKDNSKFVTDISGDGINFYKLDNTAARYANPETNKLKGVSWLIPSAIDDVTPTTTGSADGLMLDFTLELSRTQLTANYSDDLLVYLGSGTKIEPVTAEGGDAAQQAQRAKDLAAVAASRMSIVNTTGTAEVIALYAPEAEPETFNRWIGNKVDGSKDWQENFNNKPLYTYLAEGDAEDTAYTIEGYKLVEMPSAKVLTGTFDDHDDPTADNTLDKGMILELKTDAAVKLNFRVWIEGTDSDTGYKGNDPIGGKIKLSLDLYTLQRAHTPVQP